MQYSTCMQGPSIPHEFWINLNNVVGFEYMQWIMHALRIKRFHNQITSGWHVQKSVEVEKCSIIFWLIIQFYLENHIENWIHVMASIYSVHRTAVYIAQLEKEKCVTSMYRVECKTKLCPARMTTIKSLTKFQRVLDLCNKFNSVWLCVPIFQSNNCLRCLFNVHAHLFGELRVSIWDEAIANQPTKRNETKETEFMEMVFYSVEARMIPITKKIGQFDDANHLYFQSDSLSLGIECMDFYRLSAW